METNPFELRPEQKRRQSWWHGEHRWRRRGVSPPSTHGVCNWAARLAMPTVMRASQNAKPAPPSEAAWDTPALSRGADVWLAEV